MKSIKRFICILFFLVFGGTNVVLADNTSGGNHGITPGDLEQGCAYVGVALGAVGGYGVGRAANELAGVIVSALGGHFGGTDFAEICSEGIVDYLDAWDSVDINYPDWLDDNCGGEYWNCPDPLLNPLPENPWDCDFIGSCLPQIIGFGSNSVSVNDIINGLFYLEYALAVNSWDVTIGL